LTPDRPNRALNFLTSYTEIQRVVEIQSRITARSLKRADEEIRRKTALHTQEKGTGGSVAAAAHLAFVSYSV